jgi:hypothetical protein
MPGQFITTIKIMKKHELFNAKPITDNGIVSGMSVSSNPPTESRASLLLKRLTLPNCSTDPGQELPMPNLTTDYAQNGVTEYRQI